ncbi:NACHT domain-containing protein [Actinopolyspora mzabensis]|uniref:NACHT domain-containing protein n=1 Tax=Actinopolyspora mzabensis TaxID=995066 RepID=A0A1G8ZXI8_ACTMZ|nr:NACHT domain-containing protein [Actinopolyspora mzabensis]SDK19763.1 NACHT domain-containing protein [Actinopolyspora mzabensis]
MESRVWSPRSRLSTGIGLVLLMVGLAWLTVWLLGKTGSSDGAGIANVLALPATVLGTVISMYGLRVRPQADDPAVLADRARTLLTQVITHEERTLQRLLGDTGQPSPADVGFTQPELLHWRTDGGDRHGSLDSIASFYQQLDRGRLVVLGEAGAGKTVLVTRLLLDLASNAHETMTVPGADSMLRVRVPVRLSLSAFTTSIDTTTAVVRERLDVWIAEQLTTIYGLEAAVARALVTSGWVWPILDGLDEMDTDDADPVRGQAVIAALNLPAGPDRWGAVLTCRSSRYQQLANGIGAGGSLQDATVVTMQPLNVDQVIAWLAHRFPAPGGPDGIQQRWQPVVDALRADPAGPLAACLALPLRLYLAVTDYQGPHTSPQELTGLGRDDLDNYLFSQLIPAITAHHARGDGSHYDPDDVARWLHILADHLAYMRQQKHSGIDLHLHEIWRTTSDLRQLSGWRGFFTSLVYRGMSIVWSHPSPSHSVKRLNLYALRDSVGRRRAVGKFGFGVAFALVSGVMLGFLVGMQHGHIVGLGSGIIFSVSLFPLGLAFGFIDSFSDTQQAVSCPSASVRQALARDLAQVIVITFAAMFACGFLSGITGEFYFGVVSGFMGGLVIGFRNTPWPHYARALFGLSRAGRLPVRPAQFLDWAHSAGLVRLAGIAVQFRHRDLQERLTTQPSTIADSHHFASDLE